mmetsp:Transcript_2512/g.8926  ORF Transcript_2512/g.8926 Transcript_2512/m.8926 type:complete len:872 (+) Transcript_2512:51-2666(+)
MGRILIYITTGCTHCVRAKKIFDNKGVPYELVNLVAEPHRRDEMITASGGKKTVPQIFFNDEHIGGADDLYALELDGLLDAKIELCLNTHPEYQISAAAADTDASEMSEISEPSSGSHITHSTEKKRHRRTRRSRKKKKEKPDFLASQLLRQYDMITGPKGLKRKKRGWGRQCKTFKGKHLVVWIVENMDQSIAEAVELGEQLLKHGYIFRMKKGDQPFGNDTQLYRLKADENTNILNFQRAWTGTPRSASAVASELQKKMLKISDLYITKDGRGVDYEACSRSDAFRAYRNVAVELQAVDISDLDQAVAKAFWLNLYNALIIHANISVGPPTNFLQRSRFFGSLAYVIGGQRYTLSEMEHGMLRCNAKPPAAFSKLIKRNDPRRQFVIKELDPRIHFALVCGAKSCPPIRVYSPENLDTALLWATEGFCSEEVEIRSAKAEVVLSRIFQWYARDFGDNNKEILLWIAQFLDKDRKAELLYLLNNGKVKVKYATYDWDTNNRYGVEEEQILNNDPELASMRVPNSSSPNSRGDLTFSNPKLNKLVDGRGILRQFGKQAWELDFNDVELFEKIGQGGFGEVYRGTWKGEEVAVKRLLHDALTDQELENFFQEIKVMSQLKHPNVVHFMGAALQAPNLCVLTEFVARGNMREVLKKCQLSLRKKVEMCIGAAEGVLYLHTRDPPIVHRDIKCLNLLVNEDFVVKVADFGLSKAIPADKTQTNTRVGTLNWLAPEVLAETSPYTEKADVFSFGMVLWEMLSGRTPFEGKTPLQVVRALDTGKRPPIEDDTNADFAQLVRDCWAQDMNARPTFSVIVERLKSLHTSLPQRDDDIRELDTDSNGTDSVSSAGYPSYGVTPSTGTRRVVMMGLKSQS